MIIKPAKTIQGTLSLPGDKSISHRAAIMAALARGTTRIENFAPGADCASTLSCLKQLGVEIERDGNTVTIHGAGGRGLRAPAAELDCGNSGTTMRLLAGVLAGQDFTSFLTGDRSLSQRPMQRIIEPLTQMGAVIESTDGHAPLKIQGRSRLKAIDYTVPKPSAQLKSCVLLAGLFADGETTVMEYIPTRDHTERMLPHFGGEVATLVSIHGRHISVRPAAELTANDLVVPGDISSAAFFMIAAACLENSEIVIENLGLNPSRTAILDVLENFGVKIEFKNEHSLGSEPAADVIVRAEKLSPAANVINKELTAALIDEIPALAILGTQLAAGLEIYDAGELRVKESDRIAGVAQNLAKLGAAVRELPDGLQIERSALKGAAVDSFGDHRIAMAFAVAGLLAAGETEITGAECVNISFPGFFEALEKIVIR